MQKKNVIKIILVLVLAIVIIAILFMTSQYLVVKNIFKLFLQLTSILSFAILLHIILIWVKEFNCQCFIKDKSIFNISKKFQIEKLWITVIITVSGLCSLILLYYLDLMIDMFAAVGIFVIAIHLFSRKPNKIEISTILEDNDINIGCGAAQAYFHGYLKILMSQKKNTWHNRLKEYEKKQGVQIFSKLIILLPKSCRTFDLLINVKCIPSIFWAGELTPLETQICGNKRYYKNSVYVINEEIRFVAEYAPPIDTFYQMSYIGVKYNLTADTRKEQYALFRQTLQDLINNDLDCMNNCMLLFYNDEENFSLSELITLSIETDELQRARSAG